MRNKRFQHSATRPKNKFQICMHISCQVIDLCFLSNMFVFWSAL